MLFIKTEKFQFQKVAFVSIVKLIHKSYIMTSSMKTEGLLALTKRQKYGIFYMF